MKKVFLILITQLFAFSLNAEIYIFKACKSKNLSYEKNQYTLDLNKGLVTREFIYDDESYKKLKLNDINVKKKNTTNKGIIKENNLIVSEIAGYPAFYTQIIFNPKEASIKMKTVLNNTEGVSLVSKCDNVINFKKES
tara:strand:+ start:110 stop:523 length:414 start_codon:yes stop_codon:yes gene_type:complete